MTTIELALIATLGLLGFIAGVMSIVFQWKNVQEHLDIAAFKRELHALHATQLDMWEKMDTWVKRDRVRKSREAKAEPAEEAIVTELPIDPHQRKLALREQARSRGIIR